MILLPSRFAQTLSCRLYFPFVSIPVIYTFVYLTRAFYRGSFALDITQFFMKMKTLTNRYSGQFTNTNLLN